MKVRIWLQLSALTLPLAFVTACGKDTKQAGMAAAQSTTARPYDAPRPSNGSETALRSAIAAGRLSELRWPDFSSYRNDVKSFYELVGFAPVWTQGRTPTQQALMVIGLLQAADGQGLQAEDYDSSRWAKRLVRMQEPNAPDGDAQFVRFDLALTVSLMRYLSDIRMGRVNPKHFKFGLDVEHKKYDLPQFLRQQILNSEDIRTVVKEVEPPFAGYRRTEKALESYLELAREDNDAALPVLGKTVDPGDPYPGVTRLARFLRLLGDLPAEASAASDGAVYQGKLVEAVKRFQRRHGLASDGRLDRETLVQLNTPLSRRVLELQLALERWRWLPHDFSQPPIIVNIPEFRLRALDESNRVSLAMRVVVGRAYRHQTPVFAEDMTYLVFRPYWNVPRGIQRSEIVPAIVKNRSYVSNNLYEVVTQEGRIVTSGEIDDDILQHLRTGELKIRQKPGPRNSLGLVKLMFPNAHSVYLHSTPSPELFSRSRRDFSHGCIRVEKPAELAAWALRENPKWDLARVQAAMETGPNNFHVKLAEPIPVYILYGTALVEEDGEVHFFEDIYGYDAALDKVLLKGYPQPE